MKAVSLKFHFLGDMMVTIKDVAAYAGVSEATVSRVINGRGLVKEETRQRVLEAIAALDYRPSGMAQNLGGRKGKTDIIGVLIANPDANLYDDHLFFEIVRGVGDIVDGHGKSLLLHCIKDCDREELPMSITRRMVDGLILGGVAFTKRYLRMLMSQGIPVVAIGKYPYVPNRILVDNFDGGRKATKYLLGLGHKRIGIIYGSTQIYSFEDKVKGYIDAMNESGLGIDESLMVEQLGDRKQAGYCGMKKLMELSEPPTAVFCTDFEMTMGGWVYLTEHNISVPDQLQLLSYCSGDLGELSQIPLTAIRIGERNIGHAAARLLLDLLEGRVTGSMDISISTELVIGESTRQLR